MFGIKNNILELISFYNYCTKRLITTDNYFLSYSLISNKWEIGKYEIHNENFYKIDLNYETQEFENFIEAIKIFSKYIES